MPPAKPHEKKSDVQEAESELTNMKRLVSAGGKPASIKLVYLQSNHLTRCQNMRGIPGNEHNYSEKEV